MSVGISRQAFPGSSASWLYPNVDPRLRNLWKYLREKGESQWELDFYPNVDPRLRNLWKYLREKGESHGFGRIELLPLKYSGKACARYFAKYIEQISRVGKVVRRRALPTVWYLGRNSICLSAILVSFISHCSKKETVVGRSLWSALTKAN